MFTRVWLALFGEWSWDELPTMPPEIVLLPSWFPLNPYDWGCWARQTVVAITVVATLRPARPLPFHLDELRTGVTPPPAKTGLTARFFTVLDKLLKVYERSPIKPGRKAAFHRAAEWIIARQEADGGMGRHPAADGVLDPGAAPARLPARPPGDRRGAAGHRGLHGARADRRRADPLDRGVPVAGLGHLPGGHRPARRGRRPGRAGRQARVRSGCSTKRSASRATGRCAVRISRPAAGRSSSPTTATPTSTTPPRSSWPCAGWASTVAAGRRRRRASAACAWTLGMQSRDGGWAAFDADNTSATHRQAAVLRLRRGHRPAERRRHRARRRDARAPSAAPTPRRPVAGVQWLLDAQEPDGSWFGRWGANYVYGTGAVVPALVAAGVARGLGAGRAGRSAGWSGTRTPTAAGVRTCAPTSTRPGTGAAIRPPRRPPGRCSRCSRPASTRAPSGRGVRYLVEHAA